MFTIMAAAYLATSMLAPTLTATHGQNIGSAIGVAAIGAIFYGALDHGFAVAFGRSVGTLAIVLLVVAALTRLLPTRVR